MRVLQAVARAADAGRAQLEAADVQDVEGDVVALADFAEQVLDGNLAVGQDERAGGGAADAELVLFGADGEAGSVALDEEGGELSRRPTFGEDGEQVGEAAVGDPHLLAVEDVVLAVGARARRGCGSSWRRSRRRTRRARRRRSIRRWRAWAGTSASARRCRTRRWAACRCRRAR